MGDISLNHRCFWTGTNAAAAALSGWERDTDYDGYYLQGEDISTTGVTGGSATHTHDIDDHNHLASATHTHTFYSSSDTASSTTQTTGGASVSTFSDVVHSHATATCAADNPTYNSVTSLTTDAAANDQPYIEVIILKPKTAGESGIPDDAVCLWDTNIIPDDYYFCDGNNGTDDMRAGLLKAAAGAGDGGTSHAGVTHGHDADHTHTQNNHGHDPTYCGTASATVVADEPGAGVPGLLAQHHTVEMTAASAGTISTEDGNIADGQQVPPHVCLSPIQNQIGGQDLVDGAILGYVGDAADLSDQWQLCDGTGGTYDTTDQHVFCSLSTTDNGKTGGASTHTHSVTTHTHSHTGTHTHTAYPTNLPKSCSGTGATVAATGKPAHAHTTWTVSSDTAADLDARSLTVNATDGRLRWKAMIFCKYVPSIPQPTGHILGGHILGGHICGL